MKRHWDKVAVPEHWANEIHVSAEERLRIAWQLMDLGVMADPSGNPRDELDEIELGGRVVESYVREGFANLFAGVEDRVWSYMTLMFGLVCKVTTWRGLPLPGEWDLHDIAAQLDRMREEANSKRER